jgi:adenosylhomocysteinase
VEINLEDLVALSSSVRDVRKNIKEYTVGGKHINVLADGRLVNLAAGDGHPAEVMDMSFANQAQCARYIAENKLDIGVHAVPHDLDVRVARLKLESLGVEIDSYSPKQAEYMGGWECGT